MSASSTAIRLRLAEVRDIPALRELIEISVRKLSNGYYTAPQIESALINVFGVDTQLILDQTYFVAEAGEQLIGCGGWSKRNTLFGGDQAKVEADDLINPDAAPARLRAFYVHPDWSRRGVGKLITQACEAGALSSGFRRLELIATLPGEPLYAAAGYEKIEPFEIPLPDGLSLPAFRMAKNLV
jgi:GNAT superfamily N-acetyltransferase